MELFSNPKLSKVCKEFNKVYKSSLSHLEEVRNIQLLENLITGNKEILHTKKIVHENNKRESTKSI